MQTKKIALVICTYNREKYLPILFDSILKQTCSIDEFEIVLVDNNSTDSTPKLCEEFRNKNSDIKFKYIVEKNQGLSYARNRGYKESQSEYIAYLDDDAHLHKDYVKVKLDYFNLHPEVHMIGGKILLDFEEVKPKWESKYMNSIFGYFYPGDEIFKFEKPKFPRGSNMAFKKEVLEEIGGFNVNLGRTERNLIGGEEKDLMYRLYEKGYTAMYVPAATVYHAVPIERTTIDFVRTKGIGIGKSEKIRTQNIGKFSYLKRWIIEIIKWCASILLLLYYSLIGKSSKGMILVKYRWWISSGLIGIIRF